MSLLRRPFLPFLLPFALSAVCLSACVHHDSGSVTTQTRRAQTTAQVAATGSFSRIDLRGPIDVLVREGGATSVSVTGDSETQARVQTRVEGDTLVVDLDDDRGEGMCFGICIDTGDDAKVTVTLPAFRGATIEGSGDLAVEASGAHPEVDFDVRGSGDVTYKGDAEVVRCAIDGSGDVLLRGTGRRLEAVVHGSGDVKARDFPVEGGVYEIDGSGDIATIVHGGEVSVHINGSGDLLYGGEARITSLDVSGSGSVRQLHASDD
jgi:hypothetical protein